MNCYFNTDYCLWHDEKRTYIIQRYENNDSTRGWISVIHPLQAMILSHFTKIKNYEEILNDLAVFLRIPEDAAKKLIEPYVMNKEPFCTEYQGNVFRFPKNVLLDESLNNMQQMRKYDVEDFDFTELDFVYICISPMGGTDIVH